MAASGLAASASKTRQCAVCLCLFICLVVVVTGIVLVSGVKYLDENQQILVFTRTGRWIENGPCSIYVRPGLSYQVRQWMSLSAIEYVRISDFKSGERRVQTGPGVFFLDAYETSDSKEIAKGLNETEYLFATDMLTGVVRAVEGPALFFPATAFEVAGDIQTIERLAEYETLVTRGVDGALTYHSGETGGPGGTSVVLPVHSEILEFQWTVGGDVENDLKFYPVRKIDTRIQQLPFWFDDIRTKDNIEFAIEGTIFWRVVDAQALVTATADPTSDIWHRIRSRISKAASRYSMTEFLQNASDAKRAVMEEELSNHSSASAFYVSRGLRVLSSELEDVEIRDQELAKQVADSAATEASTRIVELQKAETLREVELARMISEHGMAMSRLAQEMLEEEQRQTATVLVERNKAALKTLQEQLQRDLDLQSEADRSLLESTRETNQLMLDQSRTANQLMLEQNRTALLDALDVNQRKEASTAGAVTGVKLGMSLNEYLQSLNSSMPALIDRMNMYTLIKEVESRNSTTHNLANGAAQLIVAPETVHLGFGSMFNRTEL